jgi:eukaryotic-like serine/threonine-protein kinase
MGEVYSARDPELNRAVAIKFLAPQRLGSTGTVEQFIQEARTASALNHPGIVTVYEVIRSQDSLAIVMGGWTGSLCGTCAGSPTRRPRLPGWEGRSPKLWLRHLSWTGPKLRGTEIP